MNYASLHNCLRVIAAPREALDNFSGGNPIGVAHARASFQALSLTRRRQVGLHPHGPRDRPEPCRATQGPGDSGSRSRRVCEALARLGRVQCHPLCRARGKDCALRGISDVGTALQGPLPIPLAER